MRSAPRPRLGRLARRWMRALPSIVVMPVLASGCYASTELEEADPGARLRPRVYLPVSGPPALAGWQDGELDTSCRFSRAEDGRFRCLPIGGAASMHFEDAECRRPVARILSCTVPRFAHELVSPSSTCDDGLRAAYLRIFELEAPRSVERLYALRDGECVVSSTDPGEVWGARRVPDDTFVAAEVAPREDSSARVTPLELRAEDGSRELQGFFDRERGFECGASHPRTPTGPPVPCMPVGTADVVAGGPGCDLDVAPADRCGDAPPMAERIVYDECGRISDRTVYEVEATSVPAGDTCDRASSEGYLLREAAPDAVPWLTPTTLGDDGDRLRRFAWETAAGETWPSSFFYDTELDTPCVPDLVPDGSIRCLPTGWLSTRAISSNETGPFADAACTELAVLLPVETCEVPRWVPVLGASETCEGATQFESFRSIEERVDAIFRPDPATGTCAPAEIWPPYRAHRLGSATPLDRFAAGELVVE